MAGTAATGAPGQLLASTCSLSREPPGEALEAMYLERGEG